MSGGALFFGKANPAD